jgi:DNA-binding Xre family transcriptional regulator
MLQLYIKEFLRTKGYTPKPHTLVKFGINPFMAHKLINNKVKNLSLQTLTEVCLALNCTPNDLLDFRPIEGTVAPSASLNDLKKKDIGHSPLDYVKALKPEQLQQALETLKKLVHTPETE